MASIAEKRQALIEAKYEQARRIYFRFAPKIAQIGAKWDERTLQKILVDLYEAFNKLHRLAGELKLLKATESTLKRVRLWEKLVKSGYDTLNAF